MNPLPETPKQAARRLAGPMLDKGFRAEGLYEYANGSQSFYRIRLKHPDTGEKWIRPMWLNGRGWELGEPEFENSKPFYRLRELAEKPGAPAWYVEGENKANALARLGVLATTAGSASSDERADFTPLASRAVTIWPDNDAPGIAHGERVAAKLQALGCMVELIDAQALELPEKGDSVDWIKAHPNAKAADLARLPRLRGAERAPASGADMIPALPCR